MLQKTNSKTKMVCTFISNVALKKNQLGKTHCKLWKSTKQNNERNRLVLYTLIVIENFKQITHLQK